MLLRYWVSVLLWGEWLCTVSRARPLTRRTDFFLTAAPPTHPEGRPASEQVSPPATPRRETLAAQETKETPLAGISEAEVVGGKERSPRMWNVARCWKAVEIVTQ